MKKLKFALAILALTLLFLVGQVQAQNTWICGSVTSEPVQVTYGITVYSFSFQASSSGESLSSNTLTCVWLSQPINGQTYNFSGSFITDNTTGYPVGVFVVTSLNTGNSSSGNVTGILQQVWNGLVSFGGTLVTWVVQAASNGGYSLTPLVAGVLLLAVLGGFFSFFASRLPWYADLAGFVIFVAVLAYVSTATGLLPSL